MREEILRTLGLPPSPTVGQVALAVGLRVPLDLGGVPGDRSAEEITGGGAAHPEEVLTLFSALLRHGAVDRTGPLPRLRVPEGVVGPGLPVAVTREGVKGPDGWYRLSDEGVERESAGRERGHGSDLQGFRGILVFSPEGRWLMGGGRVVVEDPFCRVEAPLRSDWAHAFLVRRLRLADGLLHHSALAEESPESPPRLTVWRAADLLPHAVLEDPEMVFRIAEWVDTVRYRAGRLDVRLEAGDRATFRVEHTPSGWRAELEDGTYPAHVLEISREDGLVRYSLRPAPGLDPLNAGVRARLAFDLTSDLVRLGAEASETS